MSVSVIGFWNDKGLQDHLVRATLPKLNKNGRLEPCRKKTCLVCNISTATTFTTDTCQEAFQIQRGPSNCDTKNVFFSLKCKNCGEVPYTGKVKINYFTPTIALMATLALMTGILQFLSNVKYIRSWKKEKSFGNIDLKPFIWMSK